MLSCAQKNNNPPAQGFLKILKKYRHLHDKKKKSVYYNDKQGSIHQYCCLWNKFQYLGPLSYLLLVSTLVNDS